MKQMFETETADTRRQLTIHALELTGRLFRNTAYPDGIAEISQSDTTQLFRGIRH